MSGLNIGNSVGPASTRISRACVGGHASVVLRKVAPVQLGESADALDPRRAAADDDHVQGAVVDQRRIAVGRLPTLDDVRPEPQRVLDGVERKGVLRGAAAAEELDDRTQPHHEIVVLQRRHVRELHLAAVEIDRRHRRLVDGRVLLVLEEVAQRMGDRRRVEEPGRELVEHGLEAVVVVRVHQHDVDVRVLELAGSPETGEAAAEDQDPRPHAPRLRRRCSPKHSRQARSARCREGITLSG